MREIFFDEKLGETRRNSEGCKPHGQGWDASRTGRDGSGGRNSPRTPEGGLAAKGGAVGGKVENYFQLSH